MSIKESTGTHEKSMDHRVTRLEEKSRTMSTRLDSGARTMDKLSENVQSLTISVVKLQQRTDLLIWVLGICAIAVLALIMKPTEKQPINIEVIMPDATSISYIE